MKTTKVLRNMLNEPGLIIAPGGFSPLTARIAEKVGYKCCYMSGYGVAAFRCGFPDIGLMTMNESLDNARAMALACSIPIIADVDNGYGNALSVERTVREYENAGVAAIQIEDQAWPKRCGHMEGKILITEEEMVQKIKMAVRTREDEDFLIIARTDANTVAGFEEAVKRSKAYAEAGADMIFFESPTTREQVEQVPKLIDKPIMVNMSEGAKTPLFSNADLDAMGYKLVIWPSTATWAAAKAVQDVYEILMNKGTMEEDLDKIMLFHEFNNLIGLPEMMEKAKQYGIDK